MNYDFQKLQPNQPLSFKNFQNFIYYDTISTKIKIKNKYSDRNKDKLMHKPTETQNQNQINTK